MAPRPSPPLLRLLLLPVLALVLPRVPTSHAMCECGYRTPTLDIFTDALVVPSFGSVDLDAAPDFFPSAWARDPVGDETVGTVMDKGNAQVDGQGVLGLSVRKDRTSGRVPGGEVMSTRKDILYGSFRVVMQTSAVPGTLASVSLTVDPTSSISLLLPSRLSPQALLTASMNPPQTDALGNPSTKSSQTLDVGGDPSAGWHEYRVDWLPARTDILVDGRLLTSLTPPTTFNSTGGSVFAMSHFGPGSAVSGTPPTIDATLSILSVRLFFNSSDRARNDAYVSRCDAATRAGRERRVCDTDSVVGTILSANDAASLGAGNQGIPNTARWALIAMGGLVVLVLFTVALAFPARYILTRRQEKSLAVRREKVAQAIAAQGGPRGPNGMPSYLHPEGGPVGAVGGWSGGWADDVSDVGSVGTRTSRYSAPPNFNISAAEARKRVAAMQAPVVEGGFMAGARLQGRLGWRERPSGDGYYSDGSGTMFGEDDER